MTGESLGTSSSAHGATSAGVEVGAAVVAGSVEVGEGGSNGVVSVTPVVGKLFVSSSSALDVAGARLDAVGEVVGAAIGVEYAGEVGEAAADDDRVAYATGSWALLILAIASSIIRNS